MMTTRSVFLWGGAMLASQGTGASTAAVFWPHLDHAALDVEVCWPFCAAALRNVSLRWRGDERGAGGTGERGLRGLFFVCPTPGRVCACTNVLPNAWHCLRKQCTNA